MRPDAVDPRTGLLAAIAGWAVLVYVLMLFGLGGRIAPLPDDAAGTGLPQLPPAAPDRVGPLAQYAEIGQRPLFSRNRQPQPFFLPGQEEGAQQGFDFVLSSVLVTPALKLAILQPAQGGEGVRVKLGEAPQGLPSWRLVELEPRSAVFDGPEGRRTLELRVFDGTGGQTPTPMATVAPPGQRGPGVPAPVAMPVPPPPSAPSPDGMPTPRATGGTAPAMPVPATVATPAGMPAPSAAAAPQTTDEQMEEIRKRIEARRAQRRQQEQNPQTPSPATPEPTQ